MKQTGRKGFTLIEMIGVIAIIAILASTLAPAIIKDINRAVGESEQENLKILAHGLEIYIRENKIIPAASGWVTAVATISTHSTNKITQNDRFFNRAYYVDPRFFTTIDASFSGYTQTSGLSNTPNSPRILLVSNLKGNTPAAPITATGFNAIWDQTTGVALLESEDIKIERINLKGLFHRMILTNDNTTNQPGYKLESGTTNSVSTSGVERYVLSDTKVSLVEAPFIGNVLAMVFISNQAKNFAYQLDGPNWVWDNP